MASQVCHTTRMLPSVASLRGQPLVGVLVIGLVNHREASTFSVVMTQNRHLSDNSQVILVVDVAQKVDEGSSLVFQVAASNVAKDSERDQITLSLLENSFSSPGCRENVLPAMGGA